MNKNQITDSEDCRFSLREIHAEKPRRNSRRKLRKPEEERETRLLLKESMKLRLMSEEPRNNTLKRSLLDRI